jgi:hypothetical protein
MRRTTDEISLVLIVFRVWTQHSMVMASLRRTRMADGWMEIPLREIVL